MTSVDVTNWAPAGEEYLGTKPKQWLIDDDGVWWLWKRSLDNTDANGKQYRIGDDCSEVVAGRIGRALGLPVAEVRLATMGSHFGVISRRITMGEEESLVHGNELLAEAGVVASHDHDRSGYTLEAVQAVLSSTHPPIEDDERTSAFSWFAGYLLLDALVGNTDRHQDNWAVLRSPRRQRLAPSFDHASCLGFLLSDGERVERLDTMDANRTVQAYARRARSKFEGSQPLLDLCVDAVASLPSPARHAWADAVANAPGVEDVTEDLEESRFSVPARTFAGALYDANHRSLSHLLRTVVP